jgi:hypothetical protein
LPPSQLADTAAVALGQTLGPAHRRDLSETSPDPSADRL